MRFIENSFGYFSTKNEQNQMTSVNVFTDFKGWHLFRDVCIHHVTDDDDEDDDDDDVIQDAIT